MQLFIEPTSKCKRRIWNTCWNLNVVKLSSWDPEEGSSMGGGVISLSELKISQYPITDTKSSSTKERKGQEQSIYFLIFFNIRHCHVWKIVSGQTIMLQIFHKWNMSHSPCLTFTLDRLRWSLFDLGHDWPSAAFAALPMLHSVPDYQQPKPRV